MKVKSYSSDKNSIEFVDNWVSKNPVNKYLEYPFYSDATFIPFNPNIGPYQLIQSNRNQHADKNLPCMYLRIEWRLNPDPLSRLHHATSDIHYHGGWIPDEISALISLYSGIRLKAGELSRVTDYSADPLLDPLRLGRPSCCGSIPTPRLLLPTGDPILPRQLAHTKNPVFLGRDSFILYHLHNYEINKLSSLIKAARCYQEAIWVAEVDPNMTWILLTSAIEALLEVFISSSGTKSDIYKSLEPELCQQLIDKGHGVIISDLAEHYYKLIKSKNKFIDFICKYLPAPPEDRSEYFPFDWGLPNIKKTMKMIYSYRSDYLHSGKSFPKPMLLPPQQSREGDKTSIFELPRAVGAQYELDGYKWTIKDHYLLLHVYEYIVRNAILNWWRELDGNSAAPTLDDEERDASG